MTPTRLAMLLTSALALTLGTAAPATALAPAPVITRACPAVAPGYARCLAEIRTGTGHFAGAALPDGYGPADLQSAYNLPATGGAGQTVAVVDVGDDVTAEADLAVYRSTFGLPACTSADGCFRKVNQKGAASPLPGEFFGWPTEISLDLDMVSAACPLCHIVLVEADDPSFANLAAAANASAALGATEMSNSYGALEQNGMQQFESAYSHPGMAVVASSGDSGYGIPIFPAVFPSVIAAGGTTLAKAANARGWTETAWSGAGSGCSAWLVKPAWQHDSNCPGRMTADISADADPKTGLAVYDTDDQSGFLVVGGTSASAPFLAGVIAQAGHPGRFANASWFYSHTAGLHDVVGGTNNTGIDCGGDYQCNALPGYDGPTGLGTPNGLAAF
jgi:subtilase family serine protease